MVLVGNKLDLEESREVSYQEGQKLADEYQIPFFESSAFNGKNVNTIFSTLGKKIIFDLEDDINNEKPGKLNRNDKLCSSKEK